jgi:hypothetical protein
MGIMKSKLHRISIIGLFTITCLLTGCGSGQIFGPTLTPIPTITSTPTATNTAILTPTLTSTSTPVPTSTLTPVPPTTTVSNATGDEGSSLAIAVVIQADDEFAGIAMENIWLESHHPNYQKISQSTTFEGDLVYDLIAIVTADGTKLTIYFDITSFFGKL